MRVIPTASPDTWSTFTSAGLGISLEYPSNLIAPEPGSGNATSSVRFSLADKTVLETPNAWHMSVTADPTQEPSIEAYFESHGYQIAPGLAASTTVAGEPAVEMLETAYTYATVYVLHNGTFYTFSINLTPEETERVLASVEFMPNFGAYVGDISSNPDGSYLYSSSKYGISFVFPKGWQVGDNHLGYDTLQLLDYDPTDPSVPDKDGIVPGYDKIEAAITASNTYTPSSDYPEKSHRTLSTTVAGQHALATEVELQDGTKFVSYAIELPALPGKFFTITAYGSDTAFAVLGGILKSLRFGSAP